jgi:hypothetical protein
MDKTARNVIAENLKALMAARPKLNTFPKITAAGGPSNGTLDRIRRAESGCSLDQLDLLGKVFELDPWQLLVPNLQANNPPILLGAGGDVERMLYARLDKMGREIAELREAGQTSPGELDALGSRGEVIVDRPATRKAQPKRSAK